MTNLDRIKILYNLASQTRYPKVFSFHDCLPDVFSMYVDLLIYKRYRIMGAEELLDRLNLKSRFKKEVHLTFDDGRRNCWTVIFPLLKRYKIKASFFVIPSRIKDTQEYFPNLEDYWAGKVSWENLYLSHRRQPYLTWKELATIQASGLVDIFSHGKEHKVVAVSSRVIDFQHPGVYEMPVYFDEWFQSGEPALDALWGTPVYERAWAPFASNVYMPARTGDVFMQEFVKNNGGFLFFKKKDWRKKLFAYFYANSKSFAPGHFKKLEDKEDAGASISESKKAIEERLKNSCICFSLPLYQGSREIYKMAADSGYRAVFAGPAMQPGLKARFGKRQNTPFILSRIPSFWIKFLAYL